MAGDRLRRHHHDGSDDATGGAHRGETGIAPCVRSPVQASSVTRGVQEVPEIVRCLTRTGRTVTGGDA